MSMIQLASFFVVILVISLPDELNCKHLMKAKRLAKRGESEIKSSQIFEIKPIIVESSSSLKLNTKESLEKIKVKTDSLSSEKKVELMDSSLMSSELFEEKEPILLVGKISSEEMNSKRGISKEEKIVKEPFKVEEEKKPFVIESLSSEKKIESSSKMLEEDKKVEIPVKEEGKESFEVKEKLFRRGFEMDSKKKELEDVDFGKKDFVKTDFGKKDFGKKLF